MVDRPTRKHLMLKIYIDTGGYMPQLKDLKARGLITCIGADIDTGNFTPKRGEEVEATLVTWEKAKGTWDEAVGTWDDGDNASPMYAEILKVVPPVKDARHLDTAYRHKCNVFLTGDKGDIWQHRGVLHSLLNMLVMHSASEIADLVRLCESGLA